MSENKNLVNYSQNKGEKRNRQVFSESNSSEVFPMKRFSMGHLKQIARLSNLHQGHKVLNLAYEHVEKYNICQILDSGVFPHQWTSYRLRTETIYFDTPSHRYELKRYLPNHHKYIKGNNYCLSMVKVEAIGTQSEMAKRKIPLDDTLVEIVNDQISWYDIIWGIESVLICKVQYRLKTLQFHNNSIIYTC